MITSGFSILSGFHPKQHSLEIQAYFSDPVRTASILSNIKIPYNGIILEKNLLIFSTEMYVEHSCIIKKTLPFKKRLLTLCMTVLFCLIYPSDLNLTLVMDPTLVQRKINVLFP